MHLYSIFKTPHNAQHRLTGHRCSKKVVNSLNSAQKNPCFAANNQPRRWTMIDLEAAKIRIVRVEAMSSATAVFLEQVNTTNFFLAFFYMIATAGVLLGALAVICIDAGLAKPELLVKTITQKVMAFFYSGIAFTVVGYAVWNLQYYQALGVQDAFSAALHDWSFLGDKVNRFSQNINPTNVPNADMSQVFFAFFFCFAGLTAVLVHGAGLDRIKTSASNFMSVVIGGVLVPVIAYLSYGSASPLTNAGLHDFVGAYSLYLVVGIWGLILAWRLGARDGGKHEPGNFALLWIGVMLMMLAIPLFVVGCGFMIPDVGYMGPTMSTTGLGIVYCNIFFAMAGGAISGGFASKISNASNYILLGPIAGYVACSAIFDIATPWQAFCCGLVGPALLICAEKLICKAGIDEPKVAPLTILPACFSAVMAAIVGEGVMQGGMIGINEGEYAFQHAPITLSMQLYGLAVIALVTAALALASILIAEKVFGLRGDEVRPAPSPAPELASNL